MSEKCKEPARFRFTWPGRDETLICETHLPKLRAVAQALGLHLQIIPLFGADLCGLQCSQKTEE